MAEQPVDPGRQLDALINSPGREGLTGTAPADIYLRRRERESITTAPDRSPEEQQPAWREDFPIDWPQDQYVERRDFMKFLVLTSARLDGRPVLDCRAELAAQAARTPGGTPRREPERDSARLVAGVPVSGRAGQLRARSTVGARPGGLQSEVHAPVMRGHSGA